MVFGLANLFARKAFQFRKLLKKKPFQGRAWQKGGGGGGSRTRVPRAFTRGIYMLIFCFVVVAGPLKSRLTGFHAFW